MRNCMQFLVDKFNSWVGSNIVAVNYRRFKVETGKMEISFSLQCLMHA